MREIGDNNMMDSFINLNYPKVLILVAFQQQLIHDKSTDNLFRHIKYCDPQSTVSQILQEPSEFKEFITGSAKSFYNESFQYDKTNLDIEFVSKVSHIDLTNFNKDNYLKSIQSSILEQIQTSISQKGDPATFLHLIVISIFQTISKDKLITLSTGKFVPTIIKYLQLKLKDKVELMNACLEYQKLVIKWMKSGKSQEITDGLESHKKPIVELLQTLNRF
jgi:hypothetical protein